MYEVKETEDSVKVFYNGEKIKEFEVKDDLDRALELLNQLNALKDKEGKPIYAVDTYNGKSTWSFHQHLIFHNFLRVQAKFEELFRFLQNRDVKTVKFSGSEVLRTFLELNGISVKPIKLNVLSKLFNLITLVISKVVTHYKIIKLSIRKNAHVLIYTPDKYSLKHKCDFRFYPVYNYLVKNKVSYVEVFSFSYWRDFFNNLFRRRRGAIYLEALVQTHPAKFIKKNSYSGFWDLKNIEKHNVRFFENLISIFQERSRRSKKLIEKLTKILKKTEIKVFVGIDDPRYVNEIILACKNVGVKSYGFQHGHFTKYHVGWYNYGIPPEYSVAFDRLFVWNEYWKSVLLKYSNQYNENNVGVCGLFREIPEYKIQTNRDVRDFEDVNVLVPYEALAPKKEVSNYITELIKRGANVFFKIRPDINVNKQVEEYGLDSIKGKVKFVTEVNEQVLKEINVVAGCYSTFLNEMVFYDKPVVVFKTSNKLGHQLVDDGLAIQVDIDELDKILDYIRNYKGKKHVAWPETKEDLNQILERILMDG